MHQFLGDWIDRMDFPRNRLTAAEASQRLEQMLAAELERLGWRIERHLYELRGNLLAQARNLPSGYNLKDLDGLQGVNLLARRGQAAATRLVGAHYDTVHQSPGADDNGSAVAALLGVAAELPATTEGVALALFDMEEWGLLGAKVMAAQVKAEVKEALIYESIGYYDESPGSQHAPAMVAALFPEQFEQMLAREFRGDFHLLVYNARSQALADRFYPNLVEAAGGRTLKMCAPEPQSMPTPELAEAVRQFGRSDHQAFWEEGLAALMVTDTANFRNPNYHTAADRPATLSLERTEEVVRATLEWLC